MKNIGDLHFQKEILPLLDFCYNDFSRDVLAQLISDAPDTLGEVLVRQEIIKGLMENERLYRPFSYSRSEFNEIYAYIKECRIRDADVTASSLAAHFIFAKRKRHREQGRLSQLVLFFHKVHQAYFSVLAPEGFPWEFQNRIKNIRRMFSDLDIEKYQLIIRGRGLKITDTVRLLRMLEQKCRNGEMEAFWNDFLLFEAFLSISKGIVKHNFTFPSFIPEGLYIEGFYHPLIKNPVLNSIDIRGNVTLVTGPNMSGKSTLLKSIGLCVYLAHLGLAVPAGKCATGFFDVISIAINLNDDILSGYSHFMTEIMTLKKVVVEARQGKKCFAIFDELFRGTNVEDAFAISQTTIQGLTQFHDSYFFISTHLHQLKEAVAATPNVGARFIECELVDNVPVFTYRLREGWSDLRIGQIIFRQEGLYELLRL